MSSKIIEISGELEEFKNREAALVAALVNFEDLAESDVDEVPSEHQAAPTSRVANLLTFGDTVEWQEPNQPGTRSGVIVWCGRCSGGVGEGTTFQYQIRIAATDDTESIVVFVPHAWLCTDGDTVQAAAQEPAGGGSAHVAAGVDTAATFRTLAVAKQCELHNSMLLRLLEAPDLKTIAKSRNMKYAEDIVPRLTTVLNIQESAASLNAKLPLHEQADKEGKAIIPTKPFDGEKLGWLAFRELFYKYSDGFSDSGVIPCAGMMTGKQVIELLQGFHDYGEAYVAQRTEMAVPAPAPSPAPLVAVEAKEKEKEPENTAAETAAETAEGTAGGTCPSIS